MTFVRICKILIVLLLFLQTGCFNNNAQNPQSIQSTKTESLSHALKNTLSESPVVQKELAPPDQPVTTKNSVSMAFAGDVLLDTSLEKILGKSMDTIFDDTKQIFASRDISMVNLENPISVRGSPANDKEYTFRANPAHTKLLEDASIGVVSLANNHILDFGQNALQDTFDNLTDHKIAFVGAGLTMKDAAKPIYIKKNGLNIAILASSHVIPVPEWGATDKRPGVATTYNPTMLCNEISQARKNADIVVVYIHWGTERSEKPEKYQRNLAKSYIDKGADLVIGSHPHVLQGLEFYQNKLIAFSLGNFIFPDDKKDSAILSVEVSKERIEHAQLIPCQISHSRTSQLKKPDEKRRILEAIEKISFGVKIDANGMVVNQD